MAVSLDHIRDVLTVGATDRPQLPALEVDGWRLSRGELLRKARAVAFGLQGNRIEPGASVGLILFDPVPLVECLYGGWMNGNVVVPFNPYLPVRELSYLIHESNVQAIVVSEALEDRAEAAIAALERAPLLFVVGHTKRHIRYTRLLESTPSSAATLAQARETVLALPTSATSGNPRLTMVTSQNLVAQLEIARELLDTTEGDRVLCAIPPFQAIGISVVNACMSAGAAAVLSRKFHAPQTLHNIEQKAISAFVGMPSMYTTLHALGSAAAETLALPSLRRCVSVGARLSPMLAQQWERMTGTPILEAYAHVEASGFVCCNADGRDKPGSVGRPRAPVRARIVDEWGRALPANEVGEIEVCGPIVTSEYLHRPEETRAVFQDGWFATGDHGYVDDEGNLFTSEKDGRPLRRDGRFIPSIQVPVYMIEAAMYEMAEIMEVGVCLVPDPVRGARIRAAIVLMPGAVLEPRELEARLMKVLHEDHLPDEYLFVSELPRTPTGMVSRRALQRLPSPSRG